MAEGYSSLVLADPVSLNAPGVQIEKVWGFEKNSEMPGNCVLYVLNGAGNGKVNGKHIDLRSEPFVSIGPEGVQSIFTSSAYEAIRIVTPEPLPIFGRTNFALGTHHKKGYSTTKLSEKGRIQIQVVRYEEDQDKGDHLHRIKTEFFYFLRGSGELITRAFRIPLVAGMHFAINPGEPHDIKNHGGLEALMVKTNNTMFDTEFVE